MKTPAVIVPASSRLQRWYITLMFWIVGRALQAGSSFIPGIAREFEPIGDPFLLKLGVWPQGPAMIFGRGDAGNYRYYGSSAGEKKLTISLEFKSMETAFRVLTFRESTAQSYAWSRMTTDGDLTQALAFVRALSLIETILLPRFVAKKAVKRYPSWSELNPLKKWFYRIIVYLRIFTIG